MKTWLDSIYLHADPNIVKVLVGNKIDLEDERKVSREEGQRLADQHKMQYFETSAKLNKNIDELMLHVEEQVYKKLFATGEETGHKSIVLNKKDGNSGKSGKDGGKSGCCGN